MKVSGFTFIRDAVSLGFPLVESIRSVLPICDEFVVNVVTVFMATLRFILGASPRYTIPIGRGISG